MSKLYNPHTDVAIDEVLVGYEFYEDMANATFNIYDEAGKKIGTETKHYKQF